MKANWGRRLGLSVSLVLLLAIMGLWVKRQGVYDWWRLRDYTAPSVIAQLADDTAMKPNARRIFYVNRPELEDKEKFNAACTEQLAVSEHANVLGCYLGGQRGIHIYDIKDERLRGVKEVTAAHEMLHAAHDRLSTKEREHIDTLVVDYFDNHVTDERIKDNIEIYRKADASVVPNELHSILATEVRDLSPELETYYSRYFSDRLKIVKLNEQYEALFDSLKQQIIEYDATLSDLMNEIQSLEQTLTAERTYLEQESGRLEALESSGQFETYNAGVGPYNSRLRAFNAEVKRFNGLLEEYKTTLTARNSAAFTRSDLYKSISSTIEPL